MSDKPQAVSSWMDPRCVSYPLVLILENGREVLKVDREGSFTINGVAADDPTTIVAALREWAITMGREMSGSEP